MRFGPDFFISQQQRDFYYDNAHRYPGFVSGYGGGKTFMGCWKALRLSLWNQGCEGIIAEPTYPMMERILWPTMFQKILDVSPWAGQYKFNKQSKFVDLPWGSRIWFYSTENPERMVGATVAWAYLDEAGLMPEMAFKNITARVRDPRAKLHQIFTTFTPEAGGWTHEAWGRKELFGEDLLPDFGLFQGTSYDNWTLGKEYADKQAEMWGEEEAQARVMGRFYVVKVGRVYYTFERANIDKSIKYDPDCDLWLTFDFNRTPGVHSLACQRQKWKLVVIDEAHHIGGKAGNVNGLTTESACHYWVEKYAKKHTGKVFITGDSAGQYSASRINDYGIIMDHTTAFTGKRQLTVPSTNPEVTERINNVNRLLKNSKGYRYLYIHPDCKRLIADLEILLTNAAKAEQLGKAYKGENPNHPNKDDQRLTHACFAAGTSILTEHGERRIELIRPGDLVLTRMGWKPVEESWSAGVRECGRVDMDNGRALVGTDYHRIYTNNNGFTPLDAIGYGDILEPANYWQEVYPCEQKSSYSMGLDFIGVLILAIEVPGFTLAHLRPAERGALDGFIRKYGKLVMGLSRLGITSIIETAIRSIMILEISNASEIWNIKNCMGQTFRRNGKSYCAEYSCPQGMLRQSGTQARKGVSGTRYTELAHGPTVSGNNMSAIFAESHLPADQPLGSCIAIRTARRQPGEDRGKTILKECVRLAESRSGSIDIVTRGRAGVHVARPYESVGRMEVFNLRVSDAHEYFASGVLVANSDAMGYWAWQVDPLKTRFDRVVDYKRA